MPVGGRSSDTCCGMRITNRFHKVHSHQLCVYMGVRDDTFPTPARSAATASFPPAALTQAKPVFKPEMSSDPPVFDPARYPNLRTIFTDRRALSSPSSTYASSTTSSSSLDLEREREWAENLNQLHLLIDVVLLPVFGKWLGRKTAYWAYTRYQSLGIGFLGFLPWTKIR